MRQVLLISLFFLISFSGFGQNTCLPDGITFTSVSQMDSLAILYPECEEILGDVIFGNDRISGQRLIASPSLLRIKKIHGDLIMDGNFVETYLDFSNLDSLIWIGGDFIIDLRTHARFNGDAYTSWGLSSLDSIGGSFRFLSTWIGVNPTVSESFRAFSNVKYIGKDFFLAGKLHHDLNYFSNLKEVHGNITIENYSGSPGNISSIAGLSNIDPNHIKKLTLNFLREVNFCSYDNICEFLSNNTVFNTYNTMGEGCRSKGEILAICDKLGQPYTTFEIFIDNNRNQIFDADERVHPDGRLEFSNNQIALGLRDSIYFHAPIGDYTATFVQMPNWELTTGTSVIDFSLSDDGNNGNYQIGIAPISINNNLTTFSNTSSFRCGERPDFNVSLKNTGTTPASGILWFEYDPKILSHSIIWNIDEPDFENGNLLGWNFENLFMGERIDKLLDLSVPGIQEVPLGEIFTFRTFFQADLNAIEEFEEIIEIGQTCSYDPNDKSVFPIHPVYTNDPLDTLYYSEIGKSLTYTIRFENLGNAPAYNVVILDTLDENLDFQTLKIKGTSHPEYLNLKIKDKKYLEFDFEGIYLVPEGWGNNQGFLSYSIMPKDSIAELTPIRNSASIYFDQNPPIVTNTTENIMVSELPTTSTQTPDNQLTIHLFPNPTNSTFTLSGNNLTHAQVTITDLTGRTVLTQKLNGSQEVTLPERAPTGMYFVRVETEERFVVRRIIKE